jgi:hypothetical protein
VTFGAELERVVCKEAVHMRRVERETSVSHKSASGMPGRYWLWPDE